MPRPSTYTCAGRGSMPRRSAMRRACATTRRAPRAPSPPGTTPTTRRSCTAPQRFLGPTPCRGRTKSPRSRAMPRVTCGPCGSRPHASMPSARPLVILALARAATLLACEHPSPPCAPAPPTTSPSPAGPTNPSGTASAPVAWAGGWPCFPVRPVVVTEVAADQIAVPDGARHVCFSAEKPRGECTRDQLDVGDGRATVDDLLRA